MSDYTKIEITVRSQIDELTAEGLTTGEPEITAITAEGKMALSEGERVLEYTERGEGGEVLCRLTLKRDGRISLDRTGAVDCHLDFSEGGNVKTLYSVPPYSFDMTVLTKKIRISESAEGGEIRLCYNMNVGGRDAKTNMKITYKIK